VPVTIATIQDHAGRHAIGLVGLGKMRLNEMFSPLGGPVDDQSDVDWLDDLKFFIDNDDKMLETYIFPALRKHEKNTDYADPYKFYVRPIMQCMKIYCEQYQIEDPEEKFPPNKIIDLAKMMADIQSKFIEDGDYHSDEN
jgi:hypothetical protein